MKEIVKLAIVLIYVAFKFIVMGVASLVVGWWFFKTIMGVDLLAAGVCSVFIIIATYKTLDVVVDYIESLFEY